MNIYGLLREITTKYLARMDARDEKRKKVHFVNHDPKKRFITINKQPVPLEDDGSLGGKIGEKIEKDEEKARQNAKKASNTASTPKDDKNTERSEKTSEKGKKQSNRAKFWGKTPEELRKIVEDGLKDGTYSTRVRKDKQNEHIQGTAEYQKRCDEGRYPSYLTIPPSEIPKLVEKYIHTGKVAFESDNLRILFEHTDVIGEAVKKGDKDDHQPTKKGKIILSRKGIHIVPVIIM